MGDSERFDDSTVGPDGVQAPAEGPSTADVRDTGIDEEPKSQLSLGSEAEKVRRSSIRPAPPSFRPSKRDPGQLLRPAMVIHAGDVDPIVPLWGNAEPTPSHPSQPCIEAPPRVEPFALADDLARSDPHAGLTSSSEPSQPEAAQSTLEERAPLEAALALAVSGTRSAPVQAGELAASAAETTSDLAASAAKSNAAKSNAAKSNAAKSNAAKSNAAKSNAAKSNAAKSSAAATETATRGAQPIEAMPIQSAPPEPGAQRPLHRNTLSHFGAPNRDARANGSADAGSTDAGSTDAGSTDAGSTDAGSTDAGSTDAGSTLETRVHKTKTLPFNEVIPPEPSESVSSSSDATGKGRKRSGGIIAAILSAIVLAGVFVAMMVGRAGTEPALGARTAAAATPTIEPSASEPSVAANEPAPASVVAAPSASTEAPPLDASGAAAAETQQEVASASAAAPAAAQPNSVRVTLDVRPADAKVIYQGRLQPGPPYEFEVTKGKRMALEVVRFGFATQKVVLDGRKPSVLVGLRRATGHPGGR